MAWNADREEMLKKLWPEGLPTSEIAARINAKLGGGLTRNAVISKRIRMGIPDRGDPSGDNRVKRRRMKKKPKTQAPWRPLQVTGKRPPPPVIFEADGYTSILEDFIPHKQRKTVVTLEPDDCRWPIGDPQKADFHFCGAEKVSGLPYCESHARRAFPNIELVTLESVDEDIKEMENV
jgi:GcrA cell cycle regulator